VLASGGLVSEKRFLDSERLPFGSRYRSASTPPHLQFSGANYYIKQQLRAWVFGGQDFLRRMIALAESRDSHRLCQKV
jgi:hypothetical protein